MPHLFWRLRNNLTFVVMFQNSNLSHKIRFWKQYTRKLHWRGCLDDCFDCFDTPVYDGADAQIPVRMHPVFFLQSNDVIHHINTSCDTQTTFLRLLLNRSLKMFLGGVLGKTQIHSISGRPFIRRLMITSLDYPPTVQTDLMLSDLKMGKVDHEINPNRNP